ncbi:MAG: SGNH/GDSL hydrolase family protein [Ruminiclostridium sp.]|nr:SGNH/GDSL hydrolase family protein [Ruminiclostridium sp.]
MHYKIRNDLNNSNYRFYCRKKGRVAFLGGSITEMEGWRKMTCDMLRGRFPETAFDFVNAGVSSTDTTLGAFRMEKDVFLRGKVDLLFVEFAVNDWANGRTPDESIRGMEGIVRKALRHNPCIDIIIMYFVDETKMEQYSSGKIPPVIEAHEKVAEYYGVTSIDLALEVTQRINAGEFGWNTFGGLHPAEFGHKLYIRTIETVLDNAWKNNPEYDFKMKPKEAISKPIDEFNYELGRYAGLKKAVLNNGWIHDPCWDKATVSSYPVFTKVPMLIAEEPGASLSLEISGTAVGLLVIAGPDVGIIEFSIDGNELEAVDQFTRWSSRLHIPWVYMLKADMRQGKHLLELRSVNEKNSESLGHAIRIIDFLVNGI